ncbi:MAG TPA: FAD binding domain-containing protein [Bacilli bacterium]|nr:FAD binding domain-containing protein [Bacilli bacterium]HPS18506.1 FAD binding domain-containing protein [Bacilli bacterium]
MRAKNFYRASSLDDAYRKLLESPKNSIIAGGLWIKKLGQSYDTLIDLSLLGLDQIVDSGPFIKVGSMVSLRSFETSPLIKHICGGIASTAAGEIMGVNFRNLATIGGSIFGRYPFSDVITALLTLDVTLEFYPEQKMSLEEYLNYRGKVQGILTSIDIKKEEGTCFYKKVKTTALDFPLVNIAVSLRNNHHYIAVGSRPMIASLAKQAMKDADLGKDSKQVAKQAISEYLFADSISIGKDYRREIAEVYVRRGLEEVSK